MTTAPQKLGNLSTVKTVALLVLTTVIFTPVAPCQPAPSEAPGAQKLFQEGVFEEETNRDLEKAAADYTAAVAAFDNERKEAGMALYRLAEIQDKQGRKMEAAASRDRLSKEFSDQAPGEAKAKEEARQRMEQWLAGIDAGKYGESWDAASAEFRGALTRDAWVQACNSVRKPLGALKSRVFKSAAFKHSLQGAPEGDYVVLQFTTSFENQVNAVETVTPMLEKDGQWRSVGYYVRPGS